MGGVQQVVIVARAIQPVVPLLPLFTGNNIGGSGGAGTATLISTGQTWELHQNCYRNSSASQQKVSETVTYNVTYEVSANLTASAESVLSATLGTKVNTSISKTYAVDATLNPGQTWALYVEYQTVVYAITTQDIFGQAHTQYVNVTKPTGNVTGRSC